MIMPSLAGFLPCLILLLVCPVLPDKFLAFESFSPGLLLGDAKLDYCQGLYNPAKQSKELTKGHATVLLK